MNELTREQILWILSSIPEHPSAICHTELKDLIRATIQASTVRHASVPILVEEIFDSFLEAGWVAPANHLPRTTYGTYFYCLTEKGQGAIKCRLVHRESQWV